MLIKDLSKVIIIRHGSMTDFEYLNLQIMKKLNNKKLVNYT